VVEDRRGQPTSNNTTEYGGAKMRTRNRLWNPEHPEPKRKKMLKVQHNLDDLICQLCPNKEIELPNGDKLPCPNVCYPLSWTDGNAALKETLLGKQFEPSSDYNAVLAEQIEHRRIDYTIINKIKARCVAVLLDSDFTIAEISKLLRCSTRNIYRIMKSK
jgi:hypothetical protein